MLRGLSVEFFSAGDPNPTTQIYHPGVRVRAVCAHEPEAILKPNGDGLVDSASRHRLLRTSPINRLGVVEDPVSLDLAPQPIEVWIDPESVFVPPTVEAGIESSRESRFDRTLLQQSLRGTCAVGAPIRRLNGWEDGYAHSACEVNLVVEGMAPYLVGSRDGHR